MSVACGEKVSKLLTVMYCGYLLCRLICIKYFLFAVEKCKPSILKSDQSLKPVSVKTNSGQMHLSAADHVGAAVLANVVSSAHMHLTADIFH